MRMMSAAVPSVERGTVTSEENASILRQFPSAYFLTTAAGGISQTVTVDEAGGVVSWQAVDPAYWGNSPAYNLENVTSIGVIDLYTDGSFNELSETRRQVYMADDVHPTKAGYLLWWTPVMETYLTEYYENIRQQ